MDKRAAMTVPQAAGWKGERGRACRVRLAWIRTAAAGAAAESGEAGKCDRVRAWRRAGPEAGDGWAVAEASARITYIHHVEENRASSLEAGLSSSEALLAQSFRLPEPKETQPAVNHRLGNIQI